MLLIMSQERDFLKTLTPTVMKLKVPSFGFSILVQIPFCYVQVNFLTKVAQA